MPWDPEVQRKNGQKGGQMGGRPKLFASKLREALIRKAEENADALADVLYSKAIEGDLPAIKEMIDRGIGKAIQAVDVTSNGKDLPTPIISLHAVSGNDGTQETTGTQEAS